MRNRSTFVDRFLVIIVGEFRISPSKGLVVGWATARILENEALSQCVSSATFCIRYCHRGPRFFLDDEGEKIGVRKMRHPYGDIRDRCEEARSCLELRSG